MGFDDLDDYAELDSFITHSKLEATAWAKRLLSDPSGFVILDTETTGLDNLSEIVQIGLLRGDGVPLMDVLVKPRRPIPVVATRIHGITNEMVAAAPGFDEVWPMLAELLAIFPRCIIYNADYDIRLLMQSRPGISGMLDSFISKGVFECAMLEYARWYGDWNDYRFNFRWQKLTGGDHSALGDCRATLAVLQKMAGLNEVT